MAETGGTLSESLEDYLEAVFHIEAEKGAARAKDVARSLGVSPASVTGALRALAEKGLINYAPYESITLTPEGRRVARNVVVRHRTLKAFFVKVLSVDEAEADEAACKMEHVVSENVLDRLTRFLLFVENCPLGGNDWLDEFANFCDAKEFGTRCEACLKRARTNLDKKRGGEEKE